MSFCLGIELRASVHVLSEKDVNIIFMSCEMAWGLEDDDEGAGAQRSVSGLPCRMPYTLALDDDTITTTYLTYT